MANFLYGKSSSEQTRYVYVVSLEALLLNKKSSLVNNESSAPLIQYIQVFYMKLHLVGRILLRMCI